MAQAILSDVLGTKNLSQILPDREKIACDTQCTLDDSTEDWEVKVEGVKIKGVKFSMQFQRAMAAEAEPSPEARTEVFAAEGEINTTRTLKEEASMVTTEYTTLFSFYTFRH